MRTQINANTNRFFFTNIFLPSGTLTTYFKYTEQEMHDLILDMYPRMTAYIRNMLGKRREDCAEDIFHDVLAAFLEKKAPIQEEKVQAYIFHCVRNACINFVSRKSTASLSVSFSELGSRAWESLCEAEFEEDGPEDTTGDIRNQSSLSDILDFASKLPPRTMEAFIKSRIEGKKLQTIADEMGISVRAVQKHITISIKKFRAQFPESGRDAV